MLTYINNNRIINTSFCNRKTRHTKKEQRKKKFVSFRFVEAEKEGTKTLKTHSLFNFFITWLFSYTCNVRTQRRMNKDKEKEDRRKGKRSCTIFIIRLYTKRAKKSWWIYFTVSSSRVKCRWEKGEGDELKNKEEGSGLRSGDRRGDSKSKRARQERQK